MYIMDKINEFSIKTRIEAVLPSLNEYQRRRYLSAEAKVLGRGGINLISNLSGVSRKTIATGIRELENPEAEIPEQGKSRKEGGGRKPIWDEQPGILIYLEELIAPHTKGDPECALLWTNKSLRKLATELEAEGFRVHRNSVAKMLKRLGYSLQANRKALKASPSHPDRNEQFEYINSEVIKANAEGNPALSIDAKNKENIGNFKNDGKTYQPKKAPVNVLDHDFPIKELGKATPYGVYNIFNNHGFVNVGISSDTAAFAVESIRRWWYAEGIVNYATAKEIVVTADCGGSNGNRNRLWKSELQNLANEIEKPIRVLHFPPGCSKWNKIEHRLFSFISKNWQGVPLISTAVILALIGSTRTDKGLSVTCVLDETTYLKGLKISDEALESINIIPDGFHGDWNYRILPHLGYVY
jgi:transposase